MSPLLTNSPTNPDTETGTRRLDLWAESAEGGAYGDMARGTAYSARYLSDREGEGFCAEVAIYPIECEDGSYGVEDMTTIGRAVLEDGVWRADDAAEIEYDWASALAFDTLEAAQETAGRIGQADQSSMLYLRPQGGDES